MKRCESLRVTPAERGARGGFTLVEMLVVVSIIVVLASLITAFIFSAANRRRAANTEQTIRTVQKFLTQHWGSVIDDAKKEDISDSTLFASLKTLAGTDPKGERARVIWIKLRLMEAFPQSYDEVNNPKNAVHMVLDTYIPANRRKFSRIYQDPKTKAIQYQGYNTKLVDANKNILLAANDPNTESSACLLMALGQSRQGVTTLTPDMLGYAVSDTDGDGIKELVDAWTQPGLPPPSTTGYDYSSDPYPPPAGAAGRPQPLRFYRFTWNAAIQLTMPSSGTGAAAGLANPNLDPVDNKGLLLNPIWYNTKVGATTLGAMYCQALGYAVTTTPAQPNQGANYVVPVIASAGPDAWFGLKQDPNLATLGQLLFTPPPTTPDDNLYNYNLKGTP